MFFCFHQLRPRTKVVFNLKLLSGQGGMETGTPPVGWPSKESVPWLNWESAEGCCVLCKLNCKASLHYLAPVF